MGKSIDSKTKMRIHAIRICMVLLLISVLFYSCKSAIIPTLPINYDSYFSERLETQNFIFHYDSGDYVETHRQEAFHEWATTQLGVTCPKKIDYCKYRNRNHIQEITGEYGDGWADSDNFVVHVVMAYDHHECVHLYTSLIGRPSDFFNEGIAVAFQTDPYNNDFEAKWWNEPVHYWAKRFKNEGTLIPLNNILESQDFRSYDEATTYPESGSYVRFMIDNYGINNIKSIFQTGTRIDSNEVIRQNFQSIYGFSIEQAEDEWLAFLDNY